MDFISWMFQIYLSNDWPDTNLPRARVWIWTRLWAAVSDMSTSSWTEWPWPSHCGCCPWQQLPSCRFQCCWPSGDMAQSQGQTAIKGKVKWCQDLEIAIKDKVKRCQDWSNQETAKCVWKWCHQYAVTTFRLSDVFQCWNKARLWHYCKTVWPSMWVLFHTEPFFL